MCLGNWDKATVLALVTNLAIAGDWEIPRCQHLQDSSYCTSLESRPLTTVASCLGPAAFLIRPIVTT